MATKLQSRVRRLQQRKSDPIKGIQTRSARLLKSDGRFDSAEDANDYITESMQAVDSEYTQKAFDECDRVESQILEACETNGFSVTFKHQGSITTDTHIRFYSDIDLLVLTKKFIFVLSPLVATEPYKGDPMADFKDLRSIIEDRLSSSFPAATVDTDGGKAVSIFGGSLSRKIDVITGSWLDTQNYRQSLDPNDRGIEILDLDGPCRVSNFPFVHNREINKKDQLANGTLKRLIRFVKSAKCDADQKIDVSSYDIAALCFNVPIENLLKTDDFYLAKEFLVFSNKLLEDENLRKLTYVPNKTRLIFCEAGIDSSQLRVLNDEIYEILVQASERGSS